MNDNFTFADVDQRIAAEVQNRLPDQIFDVHAHLYQAAHLRAPADAWLSAGPAVAGMAVWRQFLGRQLGPGRLKNGLFFAMPSPGMEMDQANDFLLRQVAQTPGSRGLLLVAPGMSVDIVRGGLANPQIVGFKPYSCFSTEGAGDDCAPGSFVPDWAWEMAHERGLVITLHLTQKLAIAAPANYEYVIEKCTRYPQAKLILAHAGRSFCAENARRGLPMIRQLKNVWFDASAICEAGPFITVIREFGVEKLMYGSDFPVAEIRGRCVTLGDGFFWVQPDVVAQQPGYSAFKPTLVGLESVRALLDAADALGLGRSEREDLFFNNANRLLENANK